MSLAPNTDPNGNIYNGGPTYGNPGHIVTPGQYALDWITSLGGSFTLSNNNTTINAVMPIDPVTGAPDAVPAHLQSLICSARQSIIAAILGKQYPPIPPCLPGNGT
jgi:hypothetical protein